MEPRLNLLIVMVADMDRSVHFYQDVLGLQPNVVSPGWSEFPAAGLTLALHPGRQGGSGPTHGTDVGTIHLSFAVPDIAQACEELRAKGVEVDGPRRLANADALMASFSDPDGLSLGLEQR